MCESFDVKFKEKPESEKCMKSVRIISMFSQERDYLLTSLKVSKLTDTFYFKILYLFHRKLQ